MPWVRFDDQFSIHRKVSGLSDAAFRLHVSAIFWCARNLTDGAVPEEDLDDVCARVRTPGRFVAELVRRGLWHEPKDICESPDCAADGTADGWVIHDYLEFQPSKEKVVRDRKDNAARQKKWRDQQKQRPPRDPEDRNGVSNEDRNGVSNSAPSRPVPVGGKGRGNTSGSSDPGPEPPQRCQEHTGDPNPPKCGGCADARRSWDTWDAARRRADSKRRSLEARRQAEATAAAIAACDLCDHAGYRGGLVCAHDPDQPNRAANGAARAREALRKRAS